MGTFSAKILFSSAPFQFTQAAPLLREGLVMHTALNVPADQERAVSILTPMVPLTKGDQTYSVQLTSHGKTCLVHTQESDSQSKADVFPSVKMKCKVRQLLKRVSLSSRLFQKTFLL